MNESSAPLGFERHKFAAEQAQRSLENFNEHQADTRKRVDTLARLVFLVGGGALTVSMNVFPGTDAPSLASFQSARLYGAWWCLFGSVGGFSLLLVNLIVQANLLAVGWRAELDGAVRPEIGKWARRSERVSWLIGIPSFFAFLIGLGLLAWLATSLVYQ